MGGIPKLGLIWKSEKKIDSQRLIEGQVTKQQRLDQACPIFSLKTIRASYKQGNMAYTIPLHTSMRTSYL